MEVWGREPLHPPLLGFTRFLFLVITIPAFENIYSLETLVAVMHRISKANFERQGYEDSCLSTNQLVKTLKAKQLISTFRTRQLLVTSIYS